MAAKPLAALLVASLALAPAAGGEGEGDPEDAGVLGPCAGGPACWMTCANGQNVSAELYWGPGFALAQCGSVTAFCSSSTSNGCKADRGAQRSPLMQGACVVWPAGHCTAYTPAAA